jgi:hypothetical protein
MAHSWAPLAIDVTSSPLPWPDRNDSILDVNSARQYGFTLAMRSPNCTFDAGNDPISVLPSELIREIFAYIPSIKLVSLLTVSRGWYRLLTADSFLLSRIYVEFSVEKLKYLEQWLTFALQTAEAGDSAEKFIYHLSTGRTKLTSKGFAKMIGVLDKTCRARLLSLSFSSRSRRTIFQLVRFQTIFQSLRKLEIRPTSVRHSNILVLMENITSLRILIIDCEGNIECDCMDTSSEVISTSGLWRLQLSCANIQSGTDCKILCLITHFKCGGFSTSHPISLGPAPKLDKLVMDMNGCKLLPLLDCPGLTSLVLKNVQYLDGLIGSNPHSFESLCQLVLSTQSPLVWSLLYEIMTFYQILESVENISVICRREGFYVKFSNRCLNVRTLRLTVASDLVVEGVLYNFPRLRELRVADSSRVSLRGRKMLQDVGFVNSSDSLMAPRLTNGKNHFRIHLVCQRAAMVMLHLFGLLILLMKVVWAVPSLTLWWTVHLLFVVCLVMGNLLGMCLKLLRLIICAHYL